MIEHKYYVNCCVCDKELWVQDASFNRGFAYCLEHFIPTIPETKDIKAEVKNETDKQRLLL